MEHYMNRKVGFPNNKGEGKFTVVSRKDNNSIKTIMILGAYTGTDQMLIIQLNNTNSTITQKILLKEFTAARGGKRQQLCSTDR